MSLLGDDPTRFLDPTATIDFTHPRVQAFVREHDLPGADARTRAVNFYYAVRDAIRYDPYRIELSAEGLSAGRCVTLGRGWCVTKAALLAACCRAIGIPARPGYADVRNHLSTARMRDLMRTDEFRWHGYTAILLDGKWVKSTPAFNVELCMKFHLRPLEFDGREDSIYHPFDLEGRQHMEYLRYRGEFADLPLLEITTDFMRFYAHMLERLGSGDFEAEISRETR
ncbi:MAG: transglutaminase family protein [Gammaproteobacteria bacterium]|nr:transglutaminase family protein [Gammaproteobacteria bacterium]